MTWKNIEDVLMSTRSIFDLCKYENRLFHDWNIVTNLARIDEKRTCVNCGKSHVCVGYSSIIDAIGPAIIPKWEIVNETV